MGSHCRRSSCMFMQANACCVLNSPSYLSLLYTSLCCYCSLSLVFCISAPLVTIYCPVFCFHRRIVVPNFVFFLSLFLPFCSIKVSPFIVGILIVSISSLVFSTTAITVRLAASNLREYQAGCNSLRHTVIV